MQRKLKIREAMIKSGAVPREALTTTMDGEEVTLEIRGLSAGARGRLLNEVMVDSEDGTERRIDLGKLYPMLVLECAFDPESGERIFSPGDFETVSELSASVLDPIAMVASRLSGLGDKALKEAEKSAAAKSA
jgi:hypothetical protein